MHYGYKSSYLFLNANLFLFCKVFKDENELGWVVSGECGEWCVYIHRYYLRLYTQQKDPLNRIPMTIGVIVRCICPDNLCIDTTVLLF